MFICEICGKLKVMYWTPGGVFWKCPDGNCKGNHQVNYTWSDKSGV